MKELRQQQLEQLLNNMAKRKSIDESLEESYHQARNGEVITRQEVMEIFSERYGKRK